MLDKGVIRSGNHFIRIDGRWVLIDGPILDTIHAQRDSTRDELVILPVYGTKRIGYSLWRRVRYDEHHSHVTWLREAFNGKYGYWEWSKANKFFDIIRRSVREGWCYENGDLPPLSSDGRNVIQ